MRPEAPGHTTKPHVGFSVVTLRPDRVGGTGTYLRGLLGEFSRVGYREQVTVVANQGAADAMRSWSHGQLPIRVLDSFQVDAGPTARVWSMARAWCSPDMLRRELPEGLGVMHYPLTVPLPQTKLPSVVTLHDVQHHDLPEFFSVSQRAWRAAAYDRAARAATLVLTDSQHARERIVDRIGVDPSRVRVAYLGIDRARFSVMPEECETELLEGFRLPERFLLYPAALWPHKNHERLLHALRLIRDRGMSLVLTGPVLDQGDRLHRLVARQGLGQRVRHLGFVGRDALAALYRRARATIIPSLYEGFGAPPLEAMACGCPVAASGRGSLAEICGDAALTFDPLEPRSIATAIDRIVRDETLRTALRKAGARRCTEFTWDRAARDHIEAYTHAARLEPPVPRGTRAMSVRRGRKLTSSRR